MTDLTRLLAENAIFQFSEPHECGGDSLVSISAQKAVEWQRKVREYPSDEAALDDFIVIHWAYPKEEK